MTNYLKCPLFKASCRNTSIVGSVYQEMITRLIHTNNAIWDAGLASVAVLLSYTLVWVACSRHPKATRYAIVIPLSVVWLAFLPNTCYLITEWRHFLQEVDYNNLIFWSQRNLGTFTYVWTLWLFYFLFSGFGMITFTLSIRPIKHLAIRRGATIWFWTLPFFVLLSLGVFLGLILRFNSWDLVSRPVVVWKGVLHVGSNPSLVALIIGFGIFLWITYEAFDIWIDGLTERVSRLTGRRIHLGPKID